MHFFFFSEYKKKHLALLQTGDKFTAGFSLIEMIVALSIFIILTTVMLFKYNSMNTRLTLDTLAHQIAQWTRETQISAMSVKSHAGAYNAGYGLHFDLAMPNQFIFFADLDGDKKYTPGGTCGSDISECIQVVNLLNGNAVTMLCGEDKGNGQNACPAGLESLLDTDIVFTRPDPDAFINGEYSFGNRATYARNQITVSARTGYSRVVEIWTTGQVSVK